MFTIKHVHLDGSEHLAHVEDVRYEPATTGHISSDGRSGQSGTPETVWADGKPYCGGTVYVMNASGKTVARYDMLPQMVGGMASGGGALTGANLSR